MCGRFGLTRDPSEITKRLGAARGVNEFEARYNVAPTQRVLALTNDVDRELRRMRWGLIPSWAGSPADVKLTTFNARVETIATSRIYRNPTRSRRCVIFADGFYEWHKSPDEEKKTPYWIHRVDREPFAFAGLWETWRARGDQAEDVVSCTIVTAPANDFMAPIHSRMPIVLSESNATSWLSSEVLDGREAIDLLMPSEAEPAWEMYAVSTAVGNVRNDDATLNARSERDTRSG